MKIRIGKSKWKKWLAMKQSSFVSSHLPDTAIYSLGTLKKFLSSFTIVFVKPDHLSLGKNVIRVQRKENHYTAHKGKVIKQFSTLDAMEKWLRGIYNNKKTLVQQGIVFAKVEGKPVDMRSVIIKNEKGKWEVTATVARVAGRGLAITNVAAGGHILTIEEYLRKLGYSNKDQQSFFKRFNKLSIDVGNQMSKLYRNTIYGLDIGMDQAGKLWVIEANTSPDNRFLPKYNSKMYRRTQQLIRYHKEA